MSKVRRSRLEVLSILDHVDLWGADATSEKYGVDRRTLARWQDREPSGWQREEEVNRLLMIEKRAAGKVSYRDVVVGAGVAADKVWRIADRAARALRRSDETCDCVLPSGWVRELHPKPGTPEHERAVWSIAEANMSESRRHFMHALRPLLAYYIDHVDGDTKLDIPEARKATAAALAGIPNDAGGDLVGTLRTWIEGLDDESLAARQALVDAAYTAYREAIQGELRRRAYPGDVAVNDARETTDALDPANQRRLRDWAFDKLDELDEPAAGKEPQPTETPEPGPTPIRRASAAPRPAPMVMDAGWRDDGPWYDLDTGQRRARYR